MKENHDGGDKTFKCEICDKTLKNSDSYKKHMSITHSGNQNLVCHVCGKTCKNSQYLHVHLRTHTEKEKLFKCSYCDKKFKLKYSKKLHERVHTGEVCCIFIFAYFWPSGKTNPNFSRDHTCVTHADFHSPNAAYFSDTKSCTINRKRKKFHVSSTNSMAM